MALQIYRCVSETCGITFEALLITQEDHSNVCCPRCRSKQLEWQPATFSSRMADRSPLDFKRGACHNPFENLTLQHVRDEHNRPITVNSRKELEAAEKKYGFVHALSHALTEDQLATPPQHESWAGDIVRASNYQWKWARDPQERARVLASDHVVKLDVGIAASKEATLGVQP